METDPASLDPEERMNKWYALFSVGLGVLSLCAGLIPICGGPMALAGIGMGLFGVRAENPMLARIGIAISSLGFLITVLYVVLQLVNLSAGE